MKFTSSNMLSAWIPWRSYLAPLLLLLSGCSVPEHDSSKQQGFVYCSEGNPLSFNPQLDTSRTTTDATSHQLYDRLLDFDLATGKLVAGLARSWQVSDNGLVYTFHLRQDVKFHHTDYFAPTRNFNASDVLFSINRWRLPSHPYHRVNEANYPYFDSLALKDSIKAVNRINRYQIEIVLNQPNSSFLANLATDFAVILSSEYAERLQQQGRQSDIDIYPIGTGPYKFTAYRKNSFIRYQRHEGYWGKLANPTQLIFDITPSSTLRLAKLLTAECDAIALPAKSELDVIRQRQDLTVAQTPGLNVGFWAFNTTKPPFDNPQVRKALAMAVDKNTLLEAIYFDGASRAKTLLPKASWAYQQDAPDTAYNPLMARRLLDKNGVAPGFTMNIWAMPVERVYNPNAKRMAQLIQGYLKKVGVNANIISYDWSTFRTRLREGAHDSVLIGWSADNGDPDNFYRPLLSCAAIDSGTNRAMWCSKHYDQIINDALLVTDINKRQSLYFAANRLLAQEMPIMPIAHAFSYQTYRSNITGLQVNTYGGIRFGKVENN